MHGLPVDIDYCIKEASRSLSNTFLVVSKALQGLGDSISAIVCDLFIAFAVLMLCYSINQHNISSPVWYIAS